MSRAELMINGLVPGAGQCVADDCGARCARSALMCRPHWNAVPRGLRQNLQFVWSRWLDDDANLGDVRDAQLACVDSLRHIDSPGGA